MFEHEHPGFHRTEGIGKEWLAQIVCPDSAVIAVNEYRLPAALCMVKVDGKNTWLLVIHARNMCLVDGGMFGDPLELERWDLPEGVPPCLDDRQGLIDIPGIAAIGGVPVMHLA
jgi:hypothetical protein